jgi:hypothetical protein
MKNIVLDEALRSKIGEINDGDQLCDERGRVLGMIISKEMFYRLLSSTPEAQVSDKELERSFAEPGGQTLEEIKRELGME